VVIITYQNASLEYIVLKHIFKKMSIMFFKYIEALCKLANYVLQYDIVY